jgi:hypothetical protein
MVGAIGAVGAIGGGGAIGGTGAIGAGTIGTIVGGNTLTIQLGSVGGTKTGAVNAITDPASPSSVVKLSPAGKEQATQQLLLDLRLYLATSTSSELTQALILALLMQLLENKNHQ